jgi:hypothetical protein
MNLYKSASLIAAAALLVLVAEAGAGVLLSDTNAMGGQWQGSVVFDDATELWPGFWTPATWEVDCDFAVYEPGMFDDSFTSATVDPAHYVYAYQILDPRSSTLDAFVSGFTVGLNGGNEQVSLVDYVPATGDVAPSNSWPSPSSARWDFGSPNILEGESSDILYYTSPFEPEWDNATIGGQTSAFRPLGLPSPVPEPASMALLAAGGLACVWRRRIR